MHIVYRSRDIHGAVVDELQDAGDKSVRKLVDAVLEWLPMTDLTSTLVDWSEGYDHVTADFQETGRWQLWLLPEGERPDGSVIIRDGSGHSPRRFRRRLSPHRDTNIKVWIRRDGRPEEVSPEDPKELAPFS